jgi:O-antigen/teichoic acid export membrane protein
MKDPGSRKISLINNSIFSVMSWFMPIVIGFVATPLIVRNLGNRQYGLYAVILGFISYSFSFGVGKILTKYIAEYRALGENKRISEVVSATFWLSIAMALAGSVLVACSARYIASDVLALPPDQQATGEIGLYLACAAIIATILSQIFQNILQGLNRFGSFVILTNVSGILLNIGNVALAVLGYGTVELLTWNFAALCIMGAAFAYDAVRHLPEFSLRPNFRSGEWPRVLRYGANIILYQVFGNVLVAFERGWIIRKFGAEAATFYVIPMTLAIYMQSIIASCLLAVFPVFNELLSDRVRLTELYQKATKVLIAIVFLFSTMLIFAGRPLLLVWINEEMANRGYAVLVIHVLTFGLTAVMMMVWQLAESYRAPMFNTLTTLVWMAVAIPLMIVLSDIWSIQGVAAARLAGVAVTVPFILLLEKRLIGISFWKFWGAVTLRSAAAAVAASTAIYFYFAFVSVNLIGVAGGLLLGAFVYTSALFATGFFTADEWHMIGAQLQRFRR